MLVILLGFVVLGNLNIPNAREWWYRLILGLKVDLGQVKGMQILFYLPNLSAAVVTTGHHVLVGGSAAASTTL